MQAQHFLRQVSNTQHFMCYVGDRHNFLSYIQYIIIDILSAVRENVFLQCCKMRALVLSIGHVRNCLLWCLMLLFYGAADIKDMPVFENLSAGIKLYTHLKPVYIAFRPNYVLTKLYR